MKNSRSPKWLYWLSGLFILLQYLVFINVYLMGDDFLYASFVREGLFEQISHYYLTGNGRWFMNILDSLVLVFNRYGFMIIAPWLILLFSYLLYRLASLLMGKTDIKLLGLSLVLLSLINIQMTRETTFWITGAFNYLIPGIFLIASMISTLKLRRIDLPLSKIVLNGMVCILACITVEQFALMAIGWMVLIWGYDLIKSRRLNMRYLMIFTLSLIGLGTILLAPGNFVRVDKAQTQGTPVLIKVFDLVYYGYSSTTSAVFWAILSFSCSVYWYKLRKQMMTIAMVINTAILLGFLNGVFLSYPFVIGSVLLTCITCWPLFLRLFSGEKRVFLYAFVIIALGSQVMLVVSTIDGFRTSYCCLIIILCLILCVADELDLDDKMFVVYASMFALTINLLIGLMILIGTIWTLKFHSIRKHRLVSLGVILLGIMMIAASSDEIVGFYKNRDIQIHNVEEGRSAKYRDEIVVYPYDEEKYGWTSPPYTSHEVDFRWFYEISDSVRIVYRDPKTQKLIDPQQPQ